MFRGVTAFMLAVFAAAILGSAPPCRGSNGGLRYGIVVTKFQNRANWTGPWDPGAAWGAVLADSLRQTGKFILLGEKDTRQEPLEEQDLASDGKPAAPGRAAPAQLLIKGDITHFADSTESGGFGIGGFRIGTGGANAEINAVLYVVDSGTGQVLASKKCYGKVSEGGLTLATSRGGFTGDIDAFKKTIAGKAVEQAVDEAVAFILSRVRDIPWTADIIMVKGDRVYVNRGTREGVSAGQTFEVGKVEVLRDPKTGEVLDQAIEKSGMIEIVSVKEKVSIGRVTQGSGIAAGMTVVWSPAAPGGSRF